MSRRLTKNFTLEELACKDGNPVPEKYYANAKAICERAEKLREKCGYPLVVTSGYRTPARNKAEGGVSKSQHLTASALDLKCHEIPAEKLAALYKELIASGEVPDGGVGTYPRESGGWVHIDIGKARRWQG